MTTTTISQQQYTVAVQRVKEAGLTDRVTVILKDYRDLPQLTQQFDKLVSIEMIEAVGYQFFETFLPSVAGCSNPTG